MSQVNSGRLNPAVKVGAPSTKKVQNEAPADSFVASPAGGDPQIEQNFPKAGPAPRSFLWGAHDYVASHVPHLFGAAVGTALKGISEVTEQGTGLNVKQLVDAERTLYQTLVPSRLGHVGGSPPLFQALADGQAAYIHLANKEDAYDADHLTRLYSGMSAEDLLKLGVGNTRMAPVHKVLQERIRRGDFPAYVNVNGDLGKVTPTESIVMESISSIANRENELSTPLKDPTLYYKWLVTRVESAYRQVDPWMYAVTPEVHERVASVKDNLTPTWIADPTADPLGWLPPRQKVEHAYDTMMDLAGDSELSTVESLTDFADAAVTLVRDLLFATQTYWIKLLREVSPAQRETVLRPLSRAWVSLNTVPPDDPAFSTVSPENAPYIQLFDRRLNRVVSERYDRSMSLSEVVDHTMDGLGIADRQMFENQLMSEIRSHTRQIVDREQRVRALVGKDYVGLDVQAILDGRIDGADPQVQLGLDQLRRALESQGDQRIMTPRRAEILRHKDMLDWVATRESRYGNNTVKLMKQLPPLGDDPLILSEYWRPDGDKPTPLPPIENKHEIVGQSDQQKPLPVSFVLQGGGGKGFAYAEALKQIKEGLAQTEGQVDIDRYVGSSAGALTAGLMAAGYSPDELSNVLEELDFKKFYADYLWLGGGVDPEVRGINRTGMFTTRQMYRTISELLKRKIHVHGRPVLFRDLPKDLKVTSTTLNSDLPEDLRNKFETDKDGLVIFSKETTPNMDVAAAMSCSSSVPLFFASPQLRLAREENGDIKEYRMQMMDGGVVNNFPVSEALDSPDEKAVMISPPVYYETEGEHPVKLSTLNFDSGDLAEVDKYNRKRYKEFAPQMGALLQEAQDHGAERGVLALRLATPKSQRSPLVQGRDHKGTKQIQEWAHKVHLKTLSDKDARKQMRSAFTGERSYAKQVVLDKLMDKGNVMEPSFWGTPSYHPGKEEAVDLNDVLIGTVAAQTVSAYQVKDRLFEH